MRKLPAHITKYQVATAIAILFHAIGLIGIFFYDKKLMVATTPINLALMFILLLWTQNSKNYGFLLFTISVLILGYSVEVIGVNTRYLFGEYKYGEVLGNKAYGVPVNIGINWFIIIYCSGISIQMLLDKAIQKLSKEVGLPIKPFRAISLLVDGATIALFMDWLMEPVAVKLGFWQWLGNGEIPFLNYLCWFGISMIMLFIFHKCRFKKHNIFAVNLFLIQAMFFLLLHAFLK